MYIGKNYCCAAFVFAQSILSSSAFAGVRVAVTDVYAPSVVKAVATSGFCPNNDIELYKLGASQDDVGNVFSIKCRSGNFSGTTENEIQFNSAGGSIGAFLQSDYGRLEQGAGNGLFISASATGCQSLAGSGEYAFIGADRLKACPVNTPLSAGQVVGGFMEMPTQVYAYQGLMTSENAFNYLGPISSLTATYGVAVSESLYRALQQDQGLPVGVGYSSPAGQPSIPKAVVATLISDVYNDSKIKGLKFLAPSKQDEPIIYCVLPARSGVQAFANLYFLGAGPGSDGAMGGAITPMGPREAGEPDLDYDKVVGRMNANVGAQKNCLKGPGHRIGFLPGNQNPVKYGESYRFVKLNRVELTEGVSAATNTFTALSGEYDFTSDIMIFNPSSNAFISEIANRLHYGGGVGVYVNGSSPNVDFVQGQFGRGGNPAQNFMYFQYR